MLDMANTLVGNVNNTEEPATKVEGFWDGDTLANLGFANIQVGGTCHDADNEDQDQGASFAEAEWKVQGVHGTNSLKIKKKIKTTPKSHDAAHVSTIKVGEKPAFVKNCMRNLNSAVALANASTRSAKAAIKKSEDDRYILDRWKL